MLKQITVFLENKPGRMEEVTGCLADAGVNLHALSIADTTDFGILRIIVSDPDRAEAALKERGFMVKTADVVAAAMGHRPGGLHHILKGLKALDVSIEYMYALTSRHSDHAAIVILSLANQAASVEKLKAAGFPLLDESFLKQLSES
ncbi:MAG: ACT domain-containing protein [Oscillospiraceae bacterium]|nr:ACT domain-containing protein [Oscillospiraceae bacterium]